MNNQVHLNPMNNPVHLRNLIRSYNKSLQTIDDPDLLFQTKELIFDCEIRLIFVLSNRARGPSLDFRVIANLVNNLIAKTENLDDLIMLYIIRDKVMECLTVLALG